MEQVYIIHAIGNKSESCTNNLVETSNEELRIFKGHDGFSQKKIKSTMHFEFCYVSSFQKAY